MRQQTDQHAEPDGTSAGQLYSSQPWTPANGFTQGIEGPAVDRHGILFAVNYARQGAIGRVHPDGRCELFVDLPEGNVGNGIRFGPEGNMFVADYTGHNILRIDMTSKRIRVHAHQPAMHQPNDIAITDQGVLFASDPDWANSTGQLWRIDADGGTHLLEADMGTTNGIEVNPQNDRLYVNESIQRRIWVYDLSPTGQVTGKRLLIEFDDGGLDGMRCDIEGNLYVTRFGNGLVLKLSPAGKELARIPLPGNNPTNVAFGGPDGRTCFVTVADLGNIHRFETDAPGRAWWLHQRWAQAADTGQEDQRGRRDADNHDLV